jgi:FdhD protein
MDKTGLQGWARVASHNIAEETPVSLSYNGVAHVVMMLSPIDIEDFVIGFSITEGLVEGPEDLKQIDIRETDIGYLANAEISQEHFLRLEGRRRNLPGQTSCGICGVVELEAALPDLAPLENPPSVSEEALKLGFSNLQDHQPLHDKVRAVHAAAFADPQGRIILAREDIGRHNALDKLIGAIYRSGNHEKSGFVLMTSRCSVELVQKMAMARLPFLATLSAPTGLAIEHANRCRLTLVCWVGIEGRMSYVSAPKTWAE